MSTTLPLYYNDDNNNNIKATLMMVLYFDKSEIKKMSCLLDHNQKDNNTEIVTSFVSLVYTSASSIELSSLADCSSATRMRASTLGAICTNEVVKWVKGKVSFSASHLSLTSSLR